MVITLVENKNHPKQISVIMAVLDMRCRRNLFASRIIGNLVSPLSFCRVWQSTALVYFFFLSPLSFSMVCAIRHLAWTLQDYHHERKRWTSLTCLKLFAEFWNINRRNFLFESGWWRCSLMTQSDDSIYNFSRRRLIKRKGYQPLARPLQLAPRKCSSEIGTGQTETGPTAHKTHHGTTFLAGTRRQELFACHWDSTPACEQARPWHERIPNKLVAHRTDLVEDCGHA